MLIFPPEEYYGNIEYKLFFNYDKDNPLLTQFRIEKYITQLNFRINEGNGLAIYVIGVKDNGFVIGLDNIKIMETMNLINYMIDKLNLKLELILKCNFIDKYFLIIKMSKPNFIPQLIY
jgi:GTPase